MAVNTEDRRRSFLPVLPVADSEVDAGDRRSVMLIYSGITGVVLTLFPGAVTATHNGVGAATATPTGPGAVTAGPKTS